MDKKLAQRDADNPCGLLMEKRILVDATLDALIWHDYCRNARPL
jgi:hypothetical protein